MYGTDPLLSNIEFQVYPYFVDVLFTSSCGKVTGNSSHDAEFRKADSGYGIYSA